MTRRARPSAAGLVFLVICLFGSSCSPSIDNGNEDIVELSGADPVSLPIAVTTSLDLASLDGVLLVETGDQVAWAVRELGDICVVIASRVVPQSQDPRPFSELTEVSLDIGTGCSPAGLFIERGSWTVQTDPNLVSVWLVPPPAFWGAEWELESGPRFDPRLKEVARTQLGIVLHAATPDFELEEVVEIDFTIRTMDEQGTEWSQSIPLWVD